MRHPKPLRIFFDANPLLGESRTGVGHYTHQVITELSRAGDNDVEIIIHYFSFLNRKRSAEGRMPHAPNIRFRPCWFMPAKVFTGLRKLGINIPLEILLMGRVDAAIFPNYFTYASIAGVKIIPTIHDLSFIKYPETVEARNLLNMRSQVPISLRRAAAVLTQSVTVKTELMEQYNIPDEKIVVNYPVSDIPNDGRDESLSSYLKRHINKPYLLFISSIEPRKNIPTLINAYIQLPKKYRDMYSLVLAGGPGWKNTDILDLIKEKKAEGYDIRYIGYVSDEDRRLLFMNARLFVMPALYEGFGMTPIEASQCGLPSVVSDIPVFRELASATDLTFFSPITDASAFSEKISQELSKQKTAPRYNPDVFAWGKSAQRLLRALIAITSK